MNIFDQKDTFLLYQICHLSLAISVLGRKLTPLESMEIRVEMSVKMKKKKKEILLLCRSSH